MPSRRTSGSDADPRLRRVVMEDLRRAGLSRSLRRDLKDLYRFYLTDQQRERLAAMGRFRRFLWRFGWLAKNLLLKLTPVRRLLLLLAVVLFPIDVGFRYGNVLFDLNLKNWSFGILLLVLMLELKDKLLARDEIEVARQVQLSLLPGEHPRFSGWKLWSYSRPANDVGGDLVDYVHPDGRRLGIVLGDVSGKGMGAALLCAKLQATLRAIAPECDSLAELATRMNDILLRDGLDNRFATMLYLEIEPDSGRVRFVNAGHNPGLLVGSGGVTHLQPSSYPIGMLPSANYREGTVDVAAGELLVVYSDGLSEARNREEEEFGEDRLLGMLEGGGGKEPEELARELLSEVDRFLGDERCHDDLSLVVLRREG